MCAGTASYRNVYSLRYRFEYLLAPDKGHFLFSNSTSRYSSTWRHIQCHNDRCQRSAQRHRPLRQARLMAKRSRRRRERKYYRMGSGRRPKSAYKVDKRGRCVDASTWQHYRSPLAATSHRTRHVEHTTSATSSDHLTPDRMLPSVDMGPRRTPLGRCTFQHKRS